MNYYRQKKNLLRFEQQLYCCEWNTKYSTVSCNSIFQYVYCKYTPNFCIPYSGKFRGMAREALGRNICGCNIRVSMPRNHTHYKVCMWNTSEWEFFPVLIFALTAQPSKNVKISRCMYCTIFGRDSVYIAGYYLKLFRIFRIVEHRPKIKTAKFFWHNRFYVTIYPELYEYC